MPKAPPVTDHAQGQVPTLRQLRNRLQFWARGVSVCTDNREPTASLTAMLTYLELVSHGEGYERRHVTCKVVLTPCLQTPRITLPQLFKPGVAQAGSSGLYRVKGGPGFVQEGDEAIDDVFLLRGRRKRGGHIDVLMTGKRYDSCLT